MAVIEKSKAWLAKNPGLVKAWRKKGHTVRATGGRKGGGKKQAGTNASASSNNRWGWGRYAKAARTIDVITGPAQGSISGLGATKEAGIDMANRYVGGEGQDQITPLSNMDTFKNTYGGIGTGLGRDWLRSKLGIYRGMGQKKFLSFIMGANPEILAYGEVDPFNDPAQYNSMRTTYDRGYWAKGHTWSISPAEATGRRFWKSIGFDVILRGIQHFIFDTTGPIGLNRMLGKGINA